ncbi:C39 family peptidase, partial [Arthrospira platensis SPKY2]
RKQSDRLIQKSSDSAQLSITKANDAMKNTTSLYGDFAANTVSGTMGMASVNSTANATAYQASSVTGGPVVGTAPQQVQKQSTGLWDTIKNTASSIVNSVKGFFGFGGNGEDNVQSGGQQAAPAQVSGAEYANGMVYFSQYDPKWSSHPYNGPGESNRTIQTSGCGPTSAAMVVSSLTGKYIDPVEATEFAKKNNMKTGAGTTWNFFKEFGKKYGVDFTQSGVD